MKRVMFLLMSVTLLSATAFAGQECSCDYCLKAAKHQVKGGFMDSAVMPMSVAMVQKQPADTYVTMQGYITKRINKEEYHFTDGTNTIPVEIEDKIWQGQIVSPKDKVVIFGEVDDDDGVKIVDVKSLKLL
ncbi:MAG: NirD/YgiW/YdeI family stress tolerance protein [Alphaproteobacteria bacterium]|nr:NirD/YgiW/YdeI family stress tolerance protein [Alphaproteobacteria bacterium]